MKGDLNLRKRSSPFLNTLLTIIISFLLFSHPLLFAQETTKIEELTRKLEEMNKQIEGCGTDINCLQSKLKQLEQLTKEIESLRNQIEADPVGAMDELINTLPKENEFPPPFDKISTTWLRHTMAISTIMKFDCNVITDTREKTLDKIDEIYKKGKGLTGPEWPLPLAHCEETNVKLSEHGIMNEPEAYYLDYKLEFTDKGIWTADYVLLIGDKHIGYEDKQTYKLGVASPHKRTSKILSFSGWIMDHGKNPPMQLPINRYEILEQDIIDIGVHVPSYQGYTLILPENIPVDKKNKYKLGKVISYRIILPYQIVRFYPASKPELFVENTELISEMIVTTNAAYSSEEIQSFFQQGQFTKNYSAKGITQVLEIGFPSLGCDDQISSTKGAIILSGDCIGHGGYVIASDTNTTVNGKPVARIGDKALCYKHGKTEIILASSNKVTSGKKQIARIGDKTKCGAKLLGGSHDTFAGDK